MSHAIVLLLLLVFVCGSFVLHKFCDNKLLLIALNELKAFVFRISHAFTTLDFPTFIPIKKDAMKTPHSITIPMLFFESIEKWYIDQAKA